MAQLRRDLSSFQEANVQLLVIAHQGPKPVDRFLGKNPQSFPWLFDQDRAVIKAYGVYNRISYDAFRMAHPAAILVDDGGVVRFIYRCSTQFDIPKGDVILEAVQRLSD